MDALWKSIESTDLWKHVEPQIEKVVLDPNYHDVLTLVKGIRSGMVYGAKVRFPHALVMIFLFRSGTFRQKITLVYKATRQHALNLGRFALIYKGTMLLLRRTSPGGKENTFDSFLAGLAGGYYVFGRRQNSVNQQIVIYVFARVMLALAKLTIKPREEGGMGLIQDEKLREKVREHAWAWFASLSWAAVMCVFRWHPETVQSSLRSSMQYIYVNSDTWDSFRNFLIHDK
ncbi:putative peroxisomal membrane protein [Aulographum hederae CBS 113979]|uniref:Putative peroxisomal membrane protein n=1 Tax=Aulographum hederae CBS 113979 TaxID=1176131 RepID=A0A6G1H9C1_9PEZI|nr:putative peroxisomal membrane protein [Aulographum hederae CBS 113979]